ncbi:flagellar protein FliT [Mesobacillus maritimus]|uniref:flagellar protein FliT n=1 Tax=Mesobacillus maritimus TaxID=1643336 RepID=UPI00384D556C
MNDQQSLLAELLLRTEEIMEQASTIQLNMKENEPEYLENIQSLFRKREAVIQSLAAILSVQNARWTKEDQEIIRNLKTVEQPLQQRMNLLHQSFSKQMDRIQQTKNVSYKYLAVSQQTATDGAFFDKRK